ncbi:TetR/AcrR family transcriptional regulator [Arachnia propionica]|uniref:TetR/AcrR family transcriptional regulator n=1 Tax=Arachnia propionica TaxID=1750 RepID=A0A3P1TA81_9ACTN|nr:TetR/AcrR family transcriptional regulator [Arachnia propionica]
MSTPRTRLSATERRESILDAAAVVFGEQGYVGARTDEIARRAGISQALVIRSFGSKEALFIATAERAVARVAATFRSTIANTNSQARIEPRLGEAYVRLAEDRGSLVTLLHLFTLGQDPTMGPIARESFLSIYRILRDEAGLSAARASAFLANGMLVSTLLGLQLPGQAEDSTVTELLRSAFHENYSLALAPAHSEVASRR